MGLWGIELFFVVPCGQLLKQGLTLFFPSPGNRKSGCKLNAWRKTRTGMTWDDMGWRWTQYHRFRLLVFNPWPWYARSVRNGKRTCDSGAGPTTQFKIHRLASNTFQFEALRSTLFNFKHARFYIWRFPKMGVPLYHPFIDCFSSK